LYGFHAVAQEVISTSCWSVAQIDLLSPRRCTDGRYNATETPVRSSPQRAYSAAISLPAATNQVAVKIR
jgi:hypothetical protein